jgi:hypothetical protein
MSFIWSYTKNNATYAEVRSSERSEKGEMPKSNPIYLGKVIDIEKGIFQNRKLGIFKYDLDSGYDTTDIKDQYMHQRMKEEKVILDFGASYILNEYSKQIGFFDLFRNTLPKYNDSLMAMIFYYIEMSESNSEAIRWFRGSIANLLFPAAQLQSQRISELLSKLGDDTLERDFFSEYLNNYISQKNKTGIIVDSTGLPNAIHFPLTAISNHNGEISNEVRLIFVIDTKSGMPLLFRYNAGNIVDINTLKHTLYELENFGVNIKYALLDAGYCSEENIKAMYDSGINFLIRLPNNRKIFKDAFNVYKEESLSDFCRYVYHDRIVGIKSIFTSLYGNKGYVYLCVDYSRRNNEIKKFTIDAIDDKLPRKEWSSFTDKMGFFALVSSVKIHPSKLLPIYYQRQTVEQVFDISKNIGHILPLATHNENTFRGHIMLSFMAIILYLKLNKCFADHKHLNAKNAIIEMKNLKCKVYDDFVLVKEMTKDMREICKIVDIKIPEKIFLPINQM